MVDASKRVGVMAHKALMWELECTHEDCRCDCAANEDPFGGQAPAQIRVALYQYRFTTAAEKRDGGDWWHRELVWRGRM